jgi:hypothetical protein
MEEVDVNYILIIIGKKKIIIIGREIVLIPNKYPVSSKLCFMSSFPQLNEPE